MPWGTDPLPPLHSKTNPHIGIPLPVLNFLLPPLRYRQKHEMQVASKKVYWENSSVPNTCDISPLKKIFFQNSNISKVY